LITLTLTSTGNLTPYKVQLPVMSFADVEPPPEIEDDADDDQDPDADADADASFIHGAAVDVTNEALLAWASLQDGP
jgi:hypothetical protein